MWKIVVWNQNGTVSPEPTQFFYGGSLTCFERLSFQVQIEMKQTPFTGTKLDTVHTGGNTYQQKNYRWKTSVQTS